MAIDLQKLEQKFNALLDDPNSVTDFEQWLEARNVSQNSSKPFVSSCFMQDEHNGWVIICINHPSTGTDYIVSDSFSYRKKDAIKKFCDGSGCNWNYWKKKYNFRAVKATQNVSVQNGC